MYDDETLARIDRARRDAEAPPVRRARSTGAALAVVAGIGLGLQEVFEPRQRAEIEVVDPWESADPARPARVRFHWHPFPPASVAEVRW